MVGAPERSKSRFPDVLFNMCIKTRGFFAPTKTCKTHMFSFVAMLLDFSSPNSGVANPAQPMDPPRPSRRSTLLFGRK